MPPTYLWGLCCKLLPTAHSAPGSSPASGLSSRRSRGCGVRTEGPRSHRQDGALPVWLEDGSSPSSSRWRLHLALYGWQEIIYTKCGHVVGVQYLFASFSFQMLGVWHTQRNAHLQGSMLHRTSDTKSIYRRTVVLNQQFISTPTESFLKNVLDLLSQNHQGRAGACE